MRFKPTVLNNTQQLNVHMNMVKHIKFLISLPPLLILTSACIQRQRMFVELTALVVQQTPFHS